MSVPSRRESAALLLSLDPPAWHLRHSRAVAEIAAWLAWRVAGAQSRGVAARGEVSHLGPAEGRRPTRRVDRRLVEAASLLHDSDKTAPVKPLVAGLRHGDGSAAWLASIGCGELGEAVSGHPVTRLADASWFETWFASASPEALIVAYADKRAGQRLESMDERFASWVRRFPPEPGRAGSWDRETLAAVRERAGAIERAVCELAAVSPEQVRRLRWTAEALRQARGG